MKKSNTIIAMMLFISIAFAQVPQAMNYQAVVRSISGSVVASQNIGAQFSVRNGSASGTIIYQETKSLTTNLLGLITHAIGTGTVVTGAFAGINWGSGSKYLQVEIDIAGGVNYVEMGNAELLSVPYALYSDNAGAANGWSLTGNGSTDSSTNYIGTSDNKPLRFRVNNTWAGELNPQSKSTFLGLGAGKENTTAKGNVAIGNGALQLNTSRSGHVAIGDSALFNNGINNANFAADNTAVGSKAMFSNTFGEDNTALGSHALYSNKGAFYNVAVGKDALFADSTGYSNTAIGTEALLYNVVGSGNTALGYRALAANVAGSEATAIGYRAMAGWNSSTTPFNNYNVAVGSQALAGSGGWANNTGNWNTALGTRALRDNGPGDNNVAIGFGTLQHIYSGNANTVVGTEAMSAGYGNGNNNTAIGYQSLSNNESGHSNTALGYRALNTNTSGLYNVGIGINAFFSSATLSNTVAIGYNAGGIVNASNRIEIGNASISVIAGQVGFGTYSDARIKDNVKTDVPGLSFITKLRPVTYNLNIHRQNEMVYNGKGKDEKDWDGKYDIEKVKMTGFLAQEVEQAAKESGYDFSGVQAPANPNELYSLRYSDFVMPLVKGMQEQQQIIEQLKKEIEKLKVNLK